MGVSSALEVSTILMESQVNPGRRDQAQRLGGGSCQHTAIYAVSGLEV